MHSQMTEETNQQPRQELPAQGSADPPNGALRMNHSLLALALVWLDGPHESFRGCHMAAHCTGYLLQHLLHVGTLVAA